MGGRCADQHWSDFREHFEPGYKDKTASSTTNNAEEAQPENGEEDNGVLSASMHELS
jgi:hypothetical protein